MAFEGKRDGQGQDLEMLKGVSCNLRKEFFLSQNKLQGDGNVNHYLFSGWQRVESQDI